jgi:hypothetical protein
MSGFPRLTEDHMDEGFSLLGAKGLFAVVFWLEARRLMLSMKLRVHI